MSFDAGAFRDFLRDAQKLQNWAARNRIARRVTLLVDEGLDVPAFQRSVSHAVEQGEAVFQRIGRRMTPESLTQYRVALNHYAQWIHGVRPFIAQKQRKGPAGELADALAELRRQIVARRGLAEVTANNHQNSIIRLARDHGLDVVRFTLDDMKAQEQADDALLSFSQNGPSPGWYNDQVDAMQHLADAYHLTISLARRPENDAFNPDAMERDELRRLIAWQSPNAYRNLVGRAAIPWFLFATKRPDESIKVDLEHVDLSRPDAPRVRIQHPGKRGTKHWVLLPGHVFSPKRPLGAYYRWRLALQEAINAGRVRLPAAQRQAFWLAKHGRVTYSRAAPTYLSGLVREAAKAQGVRATPTRLRKTGLSMIANGPKTDFFDAFYQANHSRMDTTRRYVSRSPDERRRRLRHSQKDIHQGGNP